MATKLELQPNDVWVRGAAAADGGFVALTGEGAINDRRRRISGLIYSAAGASSFAVRATDGTTVIPVFPPDANLDPVHVGGDVRYLITEIIDVTLAAGFWLEWSPVSGGAINRQIVVRVSSQDGGGV